MKKPSSLRILVRLSWLCLLLWAQQGHAQSPELDGLLADLVFLDQNVVENDTHGISEFVIPHLACAKQDLLDFHVLDWNGDQRMDLIFNGHCKPYAETTIFLQTDTELALVYNMAGRLLHYELGEGHFWAWIYTEPIGCMTTATITGILLDAQGQLLQRRVLEWDLRQPRPMVNAGFSELEIQGILRSDSSLNEAPQRSACTGKTLTGNRIREFASPTTATLILQNGDWQLVAAPISTDHWRIAWIQSPTQVMNANEKTILSLYEGFQQKNYEQMAACYHDSATFQDAVFNLKNGKEARAMWHYLIANGKDLNVIFSDIKADDKQGSAHWEATYTFSATGRRVHNVIDAKFEFRDGKIISHRDHFRFWKWTRMALGATGTFLGWTPLVKNKVRKTAAAGLKKFIAEHPEYR